MNLAGVVPDEMSTPTNKMDTGYEPTEILMLHQQG
jgi:hypothetical protein